MGAREPERNNSLARPGWDRQVKEAPTDAERGVLVVVDGPRSNQRLS